MQEVMQENNVEEIKKPVNKRFSKVTAYSLIFITFLFCLLLGYVLNKAFLSDAVDKHIMIQLNYNKKQVDRKPNDPGRRVQLGYTYFLKGDDNTAIEQYNTAIKLDKNYYPAYLNLAIVYERQDKDSKALEYAAKAVKLAPKDYKSLLIEGKSYRKLKMYDKASDAYQKALTLNPSNADLMYEIGYLAEVQKKYSEAEEIYKEALQYSPLFKEAQKGLARVKSKK